LVDFGRALRFGVASAINTSDDYLRESRAKEKEDEANTPK
jgi:hypothetical protein